MKKILAVVFLCVTSLNVYAQHCIAISAASTGGWKPLRTAPHDGTAVEVLRTYGVAPYYARYKWTATYIQDGKSFTDASAHWFNVDKPGRNILWDNRCDFWRPVKQGGKYIDPTHGAQDTDAYWCKAEHGTMDTKTGKCKVPK